MSSFHAPIIDITDYSDNKHDNSNDDCKDRNYHHHRHNRGAHSSDADFTAASSGAFSNLMCNDQMTFQTRDIEEPSGSSRNAESQSFNLNKKRMVNKFLKNMKPYGVFEDMEENDEKNKKYLSVKDHIRHKMKMKEKMKRQNGSLVFDFNLGDLSDTNVTKNEFSSLSSTVSLTSMYSTSSENLISSFTTTVSSDNEDIQLSDESIEGKEENGQELLNFVSTCNELDYYDTHIQSQLDKIEKFIRNDLFKRTVKQNELCLDKNIKEFDDLFTKLSCYKKSLTCIQKKFSQTIHDDDTINQFDEENQNSFISKTNSYLQSYVAKLEQLEERLKVCKQTVHQQRKLLKKLEDILQLRMLELKEEKNCICFRYKKLQYLMHDIFSLLVILVMPFILYRFFK